MDYALLLSIGFFIARLIFSVDRKDTGDSKKQGKEKKDVKRVMVCPSCGSRDIGLDSDVYKAAAEFGGKLYYKCNKCGFIAPTFPLMDKKSADEILESGS